MPSLSTPRSSLKSLTLALMTTLALALPQIDPGLGEEDVTYSVDFITPGRRNTATKANQASRPRFCPLTWSPISQIILSLLAFTKFDCLLTEAIFTGRA